jgi:hypothetical protein
MKLADFLDDETKQTARRAGAYNDTTGECWTDWVAYRTTDGVVIPVRGEPWVFRAIKTVPLSLENDSTRLAEGDKIHRLLRRIGELAPKPIAGRSELAQTRKFSIGAISWYSVPTIPDTTPEHATYLRASLKGLTVPNKIVYIGVRLELPRVSESFGRRFRGVISKFVGQGDHDLADYEEDLEQVLDVFRSESSIVRRLTEAEWDQIESWANFGKGMDVRISTAKPDRLIIGNTPEEQHEVQIVSLRQADRLFYQAPHTPWIADAMSWPGDEARVVQFRGDFVHPSVMTHDARSLRRRLLREYGEADRAGDVDQLERSAALEAVDAADRHYTEEGEPGIRNCSVTFARSGFRSNSNFLDGLAQRYGMVLKPNVDRQLQALEEMMPGSPRLLSPSRHAMSISVISHSGINAYGHLGDEYGTGMLVGSDADHSTLVWLDPELSIKGTAESQNPVVVIVGDTGSGKTFLAQHMATQHTQMGKPVVFINPKAGSSLRQFAERVQGNVVTLSDIGRGQFDPYRFNLADDPDHAGTIAFAFLEGIIGNIGVAGQGLTMAQSAALNHGLIMASRAGVRCMYDAITKYVDDPDLVKLVLNLATNPVFAVGFSETPLPPYKFGEGLTLVEFDKDIGLPGNKPPETYNFPERIAVGVTALITQVSLKILMQMGTGGGLYMDEGHFFLGNNQGQQFVERQGRLARSQGILPVFITHQIRELLDIGMASYIGRVFLMKTANKEQAAAGCELMEIDATPDILQTIMTMGPQNASPEHPDGIPAGCFHRDMNLRKALIRIWPYPKTARQVYNTSKTTSTEPEQWGRFEPRPDNVGGSRQPA